MPSIQEVRQQYPQYADMTDQQLAGALHKKYYSDIPLGEFNEKVGLTGKPKRDVGIAESAGRGYTQYGTAGFGDEIMAGGAAAVLKLAGELGIGPEEFDSRSLGDIYREARGIARTQEKEAAEANPLAYHGSGVAGSIMTAAAMPVAAPLKSVTAAGRVGNAALTGGAYGAVAGLGESEADLTQGDFADAAIDTAIGGGIGALTGGAVQGAVEGAGAAIRGGKTALQGSKARTPESLDETVADMKSKSSATYQAMRDAGAAIKPKSMSNMVSKVENAVNATGKNNARLHGDTLSVLGDMKKASKKGALSLEELDQYRQLLNDVVSKNTDAIKGMNPDALKASRAISALDSSVERLAAKDITGDVKAVDLLLSARSEWQRARKFESIANLIKQADGDPNKLKSSLQKFVNKPKNLRGYSKEEVKLLKQAARNSTGELLLKSLGKFGFDLGSSMSVGNTALPVLAGAFGSPGLTAMGTAARQGQKYLGRGKAESVLRAIEGEAAKQPGKTPQITNFGKYIRGKTDLGPVMRNQAGGGYRKR